MRFIFPVQACGDYKLTETKDQRLKATDLNQRVAFSCPQLVEGEVFRALDQKLACYFQCLGYFFKIQNISKSARFGSTMLTTS